MGRKPIVGTPRYFAHLLRQYGEAMYCPICLCRPCNHKCPIGFTDEWEIAALTEILADADPKKKKT